MNVPGLEHDVFVGRPDGDLDWRAMTPESAEGEDYRERGLDAQRAGYRAMGIDLAAIFGAGRRRTVAESSWNEEDHPRGHDGNPGQFAHKEGPHETAIHQASDESKAEIDRPEAPAADVSSKGDPVRDAKRDEFEKRQGHVILEPSKVLADLRGTFDAYKKSRPRAGDPGRQGIEVRKLPGKFTALTVNVKPQDGQFRDFDYEGETARLEFALKDRGYVVSRNPHADQTLLFVRFPLRQEVVDHPDQDSAVATRSDDPAEPATPQPDPADVRPVEKPTPVPFKVRGKGEWEWDGAAPEMKGPLGGSPGYRVTRLADGATGTLTDFGSAGWRIHLDNEQGWRFAAEGKGASPIAAKLKAASVKEKIEAVGTAQGRAEGLRKVTEKMTYALERVELPNGRGFSVQGIDNQAMLPEEKATAVATRMIAQQAFQEVVGRFGPKALEHIGELESITMFLDQPTLVADLQKDWDLQGKDATGVQGVYRHSKTSGEMHLTGAGCTDPVGTYAHELTHAVDGPQSVYSSTRKWKAAWEAEIGNRDKLGIRTVRVPGGEVKQMFGKPAEEIKPGDQLFLGDGELHRVESCEVVREHHTGNVFRVKLEGDPDVKRWNPKVAYVTTECQEAPEAPLTRYGQTNASEGFAEFGRLIVQDQQKAKALFPKCTKFWKEANLLE